MYRKPEEILSQYYNKYIEKYKPLFKAYNEWCIKQR